MVDCKQLSQQMRLLALKLAHDSGQNGAHLGGGLSAIEIMAALYGSVLRINPSNPTNEERDRLVVSKGHCVLAYYTALHLTGWMAREELDCFESCDDSLFFDEKLKLEGIEGEQNVNNKTITHLHGHAMRDLQHGIEFSGGSLSMGMSFAVGEALACKMKGLSSRVYVLVGDGECDEGLIWEAAMSAANFGLNNLTVIVDQNQLQYDGRTTEVMNQFSLADKFRAFGFETIEVDGHDTRVLCKQLPIETNKPRCVIAKTIKGKGVRFMEGVKEWHHSTLSDAQYEQAIQEIATNQE